MYLPTYLPYMATFLSCFHSSSQFEYSRPARHSSFSFSLSARNQTPSPHLLCPFSPHLAPPPSNPCPRTQETTTDDPSAGSPSTSLTASRQTRPQHLLAILPPRLFAALVLNCSASAASSPLRSTTPIAIPPSIPSSPLAWSSLADM